MKPQKSNFNMVVLIFHKGTLVARTRVNGDDKNSPSLFFVCILVAGRKKILNKSILALVSLLESPYF